MNRKVGLVLGLLLLGLALVVMLNSNSIEWDANEQATDSNGVTGAGGSANGSSKPPAASTKPAALRAVVVDSGNTPAAQARCVLECKAGALTGVADENGEVRFAGIDAAHVWRLVIEYRDYAPFVRKGIRFEGGKELDLGVLTLKRSAVVSGTVKDHKNQAVAGARILLTDPADKAQLYSSRMDNPPLYETLSGENGAFSISGVAPGHYGLEATAEGNGHYFEGQFEVHDGEQIKKLIKLKPGVTITGKVKDERGALLEGAEVRAWSFEQMQLFDPAYTDKEGRYTLAGLSEETYFLMAAKDGYTQQRKEMVQAPAEGVDFELGVEGRLSGVVLDQMSGKPVTSYMIRAFLVKESPLEVIANAQAATPLSVDDAEGKFVIGGLTEGEYAIQVFSDAHASANAGLFAVKAGQETGGITIQLLPGGGITGTVVMADSKAPVVGAVVYTIDWWYPPEGGVMSIGESTIKRVATDSQGHFRLGGLEARTYSVGVLYGDKTAARKSGIEVKYGADTDVVIEIETGTGTIEGHVLDQQGLPVKGALVLIQNSSQFGRMGEGSFKTADDEGFYRFEDLPADMYMVIRLKDIMSIDGRTQAVNIRGNETVVVNFQETSAGTLYGKVTEDGQPVGDLHIFLIPVHGGPLVTKALKKDGTYRIEGVEPGEYVFNVQNVFSISDRFYRDKVIILAREEVEKNVDLPPTGFSGVVKNRNGEPLGGAQISIMKTGYEGRVNSLSDLAQTGAAYTVTKKDGTFLVKAIPEGDYFIKVIAGGYVATEFGGFHFNEQGITDAGELVLENEGYVYGTVRDQEGQAVAGAEFYLVDSKGKPPLFLSGYYSGVGGDYKFGHLYSETYTLYAKAEGYAPVAVSAIPVTQGSGTERNLVLPPGGRLRLTVNDSLGKPVARVKVDLFDNYGNPVLQVLSFYEILLDDQTVTNYNGVYQNNSLGPGVYSARLTLDGEEVGQAMITVQANQTTDQTVVVTK